MGVPRLFPWIKNNFRYSVKHFTQGDEKYTIDHLLLDGNAMLHPSAQKIMNYGEKKEKVSPYEGYSLQEKIALLYADFFDHILDICRTIITPKKTLFIALDGVAPLAKQAQQRSRRFTTARDRKDFDFDSNSMTPGTLFMHNLAKYIRYAIRRELNDKKSILFGLKIYFSSTRVPGEGEHKLLDYIRELPKEERNKESFCIMGGDADLIMLSLAAPVANMFLLRPDQTPQPKALPRFLNKKAIVASDKKEYDYVNISEIKRGMPLVLGQPKRNSIDASNDFILLGFFVGNDFLPKLEMFLYLEDGLNMMVEIYHSMCDKQIYLTKDGKINMKNLAQFTEKVDEQEPMFLYNQFYQWAELEEKFHNTLIIKNIEPIQRKDMNKKQVPFKGGVVVAKDGFTYYYDTYPSNPVYKFNYDDFRVDYYEKMARMEGKKLTNPREYMMIISDDYLEGIFWVFQYYTQGIPSWSYFYPYHYPPLLKDVTIRIRDMISDHKSISFEKDTPFLPFEQLMSVLPPVSGMSLLPKEFDYVFTKSKLYKEGYYDETFEPDFEGKTKDHMAVIPIKFIDKKLVQKVYGEMKKKVDMSKYVRNTFDILQVFEYSKNHNMFFTSEYGNIKHNHVQAWYMK